MPHSQALSLGVVSYTRVRLPGAAVRLGKSHPIHLSPAGGAAVTVVLFAAAATQGGGYGD
jgi:hypothetical protein